nr:hypothetical protein [Chlamydia sp. 17-3921]
MVYFAERLLSSIARIGKTSPKSWWWTLMIATRGSSLYQRSCLLRLRTESP